MNEINIANFSGPLDLLLHLAKTNEIEIKDISLDELINQYLNYIKRVQELGIDIASSYLEMAAELIRLKSMYLLPNASDDEVSEIFEEIGLDREALIQKLLEYKSYKEVVGDFRSLIDNRQSFYPRPSEPLIEYRKNNFENSITMEQIYNTTLVYLQSQAEKSKDTKVINHNELNIEKYMDNLKVLTAPIYFSSFILENDISNIISLFLAVLESLKNQVITITILDNDFIIKEYEGESCNE